MLNTFESCGEAKRAGKSIEEAASAYTIPEKFVGYRSPRPETVRINVEAMYAELD